MNAEKRGSNLLAIQLVATQRGEVLPQMNAEKRGSNLLAIQLVCVGLRWSALVWGLALSTLTRYPLAYFC